MPMYNFSCAHCGKSFVRILSSSDISAVTCSSCGSPDITKVHSAADSLTQKSSTKPPTGALSGGSCSSGFC